MYFETVMDESTEELEDAGYKLIDKSFEGILEIMTSLETEQKLTRKLTEETDDYIQGIFIWLSISVAITVLVFAFSTAILVRFYKKQKDLWKMLSNEKKKSNMQWK